jgi:hypothetical protein
MYTQTTTGNDSGYQHTEQQLTAPIRTEIAEEPYQEQIPMNERATTGWKPSRAEMLGEYPITIEFLTIGCIVSVGCKRIPFTTIAEGMKELNAYVEDPIASKDKWEKLFEQNK